MLMSKPNSTLSEFGKCVLALAEWLEQDPPLDMVEQVFIENHVHVLRLSFGAWKRRRGKNSPPDPKAI